MMDSGSLIDVLKWVVGIPAAIGTVVTLPKFVRKIHLECQKLSLEIERLERELHPESREVVSVPLPPQLTYGEVIRARWLILRFKYQVMVGAVLCGAGALAGFASMIHQFWTGTIIDAPAIAILPLVMVGQLAISTDVPRTAFDGSVRRLRWQKLRQGYVTKQHEGA